MFSREVDDIISAPELWRDLVNRHPIVLINGVVYNPGPHGEKRHNFPVYLSKEELLQCDVDDERWPFVKPIVNSNVIIQKNHIFAISPLVYLWPPDKIIAPGCEVMSFLMVDLDLPKNSENFSQITSVLESDFQSTKWALIDSGNSYHIVFDALISPKTVPWHFGDIIKKFAKIGPIESKQMCEGFGNYMQEFWDNSEKLNFICEEILAKVTHYDDPKSEGIHFPVDLRWMAHTLLEMIQFDGIVHGTYGYLRVNKKQTGGQMPIVVAKSTNFYEDVS